MQQIGVGLADFGGYRLQRHRLRPALEEEMARSLECGGAATLRGKSLANY